MEDELSLRLSFRRKTSDQDREVDEDDRSLPSVHHSRRTPDQRITRERRQKLVIKVKAVLPPRPAETERRKARRKKELLGEMVQAAKEEARRQLRMMGARTEEVENFLEDMEEAVDQHTPPRDTPRRDRYGQPT